MGFKRPLVRIQSLGPNTGCSVWNSLYFHFAARRFGPAREQGLPGVQDQKNVTGEGNTMASSKPYLDFILEQLSGLEEVSFRAMMREYVLYYRGKVIGGIYDDRLLVKPVKSAAAMRPDAVRELPYEGAKEMLLVDRVEDREFLCRLLEAMYDELPAPRRKR